MMPFSPVPSWLMKVIAKSASVSPLNSIFVAAAGTVPSMLMPVEPEYTQKRDTLEERQVRIRSF